jgi:hypothetical protein
VFQPAARQSLGLAGIGLLSLSNRVDPVPGVLDVNPQALFARETELGRVGKGHVQLTPTGCAAKGMKYRTNFALDVGQIRTLFSPPRGNVERLR